MIHCQLADILANLPDEAQGSLRGHARQAGLGWQQFWMLLHNRVERVSLKNVQQLRTYLAPLSDQVQAGDVRLHLGDILDERGLTQTAASEESGVSYATVNRMANNLLRYVDFGVLDRLYRYLELDNLEELIETGGLLVWQADR